MIYLFEDRKDRMHHLLHDKIENYLDVLSIDKIIDISKEDLVSFFSSFKELDVVIFHKSYVFLNKNITIDDVKEVISQLGKKFVLFSGGLDNAIISDDEVVINSGTLYKNLNNFLSYYRKSNTPNLNYLIFNNEKEFMKHQLKKFQNLTLLELIKLKKEYNEENSVRTYKKIKQYIDLYLISNEFDEDKHKLSEFIDKNLLEKKYNYSVLFEQIKKMIGKYEIS